MYFDAILDRHGQVLFNGTREQCLSYLETSKDYDVIDHWTCIPGETLEQLDPDVYASRYAGH